MQLVPKSGLWRQVVDNIDLSELNYIAIVVAVVINMAGGAAWYGILGKQWMAAAGLTREDMEAMRGTSRMWYPYVIAVISSLVFALVLAVIIQGLLADEVLEGLLLGLLAGIGFVATSNAAGYSFEGRSLRLYLINTGYPVVMYAIVGVLLSAWQ